MPQLRERLVGRQAVKKSGPSAYFPRIRKAPPPNPRVINPEQAELMRQIYALGVHYRLLGEMFEVAPGCAHHAVTYRGAYKRDKGAA